MLIAIAVSLLFLVQCKGSNVEDFGFQEDIKEHFGEMNYAKTVFANKISSRNKVDYQRGSGILEDGDGKELNYKWAYLIGENGDLLAGYLGTSLMTSTTTVELTRDETRDAIRRCARIGEVSDRFACFDRVVEKMASDCQNSLDFEDCKVHCFYDPGLCGGMVNP
jgi:hypothetical protein